MAWVLPVMAIAGTIFSAMGSHNAGKAQQRGLDFEASQMEMQAGQTRASSQRAAMEHRRQARLVNSRLQALAPGSDPTVARQSAEIAGEGEYRALSSLYEGEERARGLEAGALGRRYTGQAASTAGNIRGISTVFNNSRDLYSAGSSLYEKYGRGGPSSQFETYDPQTGATLH